MKTLLIVALLALALSQNIMSDFKVQSAVCFAKSKSFYAEVDSALNQKSMDAIIDSLEKMSEKVPSLLRACGAEEQAVAYETAYSPACTKILAKEAKIFVKIMKLYAEDQQKNEKQILIYTAMFETLYKTQVQKKCPYFAEQHLMETKSKGECAEGAYRLSLVFEKLDNDLMAGKFNDSLTDMGKVVKQLPLFLESCDQVSPANVIRSEFPDECLNAIGALVRETASLEHHYTHFQWLEKHFKDFTKDVIQVRVTCPFLQHN